MTSLAMDGNNGASAEALENWRPMGLLGALTGLLAGAPLSSAWPGRERASLFPYQINLAYGRDGHSPSSSAAFISCCLEIITAITIFVLVLLAYGGDPLPPPASNPTPSRTTSQFLRLKRSGQSSRC